MIENPLNQILGHYCIEAYCGYAKHLLIKCSQHKDLLNILLNSNLEPEFDFETVTAAWRLIDNDIILTGSFEDNEHNDNYLKLLNGKIIIDIKYTNNTDIQILFNDKLIIETFNQGLEFNPIQLYNNIDEVCWILNPYGKWFKESSDLSYTEQNLIENLHSELTTKRWKNIVPNNVINNHCRDCAYFLKTSGQHYFWDYGICSNKHSDYDGKVVGIKSTCEYFSIELDKEI